MEENIQTPEKGTEQETFAPEEETLKDESGEDLAENKSKEESSPPPVDYKKKFSESAKEVAILREQIANLNRRVEAISKEEAPAEAELKKNFPQWEEMSQAERELAIKSLTLERRLNKFSADILRFEEEKKWNEALEKFLERNELTDSFPDLIGKEKEFKKFALKPTHRGVSLEVLAKAFLYGAPPKKEEKVKVSLVEKGSGGQKNLPKKGYSVEELALLRKNDPKKYREVLLKGGVNTDEI